MKATIASIVIAMMLSSMMARADDCSPKDVCGDDNCSQPTDTRDCEPHWGCPDCKIYQVGCHVERAGCEADKVRYRKQCEAAKA